MGGVLLERPFKIRRLGHFGLNALKMEECVRFYSEDLGYRISDKRNFGERAKSQEAIAGFGDPHGYFMRYGTDHHSFVLFNKRVREYIDTERHFAPGVVMNQISWQVGSLGEVSNGCDWLNEEGLKIQRSGRDMPGSNWHTYFYDPDGHTNELYYGMEQVGWDARSKPAPMWDRMFRVKPELPQISEDEEVRVSEARGDDLNAGYEMRDSLPGKDYDVDGILLPRPFKIIKGGPISLFTADIDAAARFYSHELGLRISEETVWNGARCVFLRANTEHHTIALYPIELREKTRLATGFDHVLDRYPSRFVPSAPRCARVPRKARTQIHRYSSRVASRHRLRVPRARPRWASRASVLLDGANRLGRPCATGIIATESETGRMACGDRG